MRVDEDAYFAGTLRAQTLVIPSGTIVNASVNAAAAIASSKLEHQHVKTYGQSGTAAAATVPIHVVQGTAGTILSLKAATIAACTGDATVTVDLKKAGSSILTGVITLDSANTARVAEAGTVSSATLAAGDFLELVIAVNAGTGSLGTGLCVQLVLDEDAI